MTAWHAIHPSPYDDSCPDCAGYPEPTPEPRPDRRVLVVLVALLAVAYLVRRTNRG